jgi:hypothetical protein
MVGYLVVTRIWGLLLGLCHRYKSHDNKSYVASMKESNSPTTGLVSISSPPVEIAVQPCLVSNLK